MKTVLHYLLVLCLFWGAVGCSDEDEGIERIYPDEEQVPFEKENLESTLRYDEDFERWIVTPERPEPGSSNGFPLGIEEGVRCFVENMKDEYKAYEGPVTVSGVFLYLYREVTLPMDGSHVTIYNYSLQIKDIQPREKEKHE